MTVREEDVHDRNPVRQGHVSAYLFTPSAVACESLASPLCLLTELTHGRFASNLCPCLRLSVCLFLSPFVSITTLRVTYGCGLDGLRDAPPAPPLDPTTPPLPWP